jgi:hypothetical protein
MQLHLHLSLSVVATQVCCLFAVCYLQLGALSVLSEISQNADIRRGIADLGAIPILVTILSDQARDLQILAAETIANIGKICKARRAIRKCSGIPKLVITLPLSVTNISSFLGLLMIKHK